MRVLFNRRSAVSAGACSRSQSAAPFSLSLFGGQRGLQRHLICERRAPHKGALAIWLLFGIEPAALNERH